MKSESLPLARLGVLKCIALLTFFAGARGSRLDDPISLTVSTGGGNKSSPLLYGLMFEVSISVKSLAVFMLTSHAAGDGPFWYGTKPHITDPTNLM